MSSRRGTRNPSPCGALALRPDTLPLLAIASITRAEGRRLTGGDRVRRYLHVLGERERDMSLGGTRRRATQHLMGVLFLCIGIYIVIY